MQSSNDPKQAIVVNMAVNYPLGRLVAQACHASMLNIFHHGSWSGNTFQINTSGNEDLEYWMKDHFTKIVFKAWGEDQLVKIANAAELQDIPCNMMTEDDGNLTAIALGPTDASKLNTITKSLILL